MLRPTSTLFYDATQLGYLDYSEFIKITIDNTFTSSIGPKYCLILIQLDLNILLYLFSNSTVEDGKT